MLKRIKTLSELKKLSKRYGGISVTLYLKDGLRASKGIEYVNGKYEIWSMVDDSVTSSFEDSNIVEAIKNNTLFYDD